MTPGSRLTSPAAAARHSLGDPGGRRLRRAHRPGDVRRRDLMDVMVAQSLAPQTLRRAPGGMGETALPRRLGLPPGRRGGPGGDVRPRARRPNSAGGGWVMTIAGWRWIAMADRRADGVTVTGRGCGRPSGFCPVTGAKSMPRLSQRMIDSPGRRSRRYAHNADSAPLSGVEWAAVTKRGSAISGLLPREQMRARMSAAKAVGCVPVGVLGWTGEWCHHVIAGMPGAYWRALFEPGVRLTRRRDCGPRAP
jgi:hypothetical protein